MDRFTWTDFALCRWPEALESPAATLTGKYVRFHPLHRHHPHHAMPYDTTTSQHHNTTSPQHTAPCHTALRHAMPRRATPRSASPDLPGAYFLNLLRYPSGVAAHLAAMNEQTISFVSKQLMVDGETTGIRPTRTASRSAVG